MNGRSGFALGFRPIDRDVDYRGTGHPELRADTFASDLLQGKLGDFTPR